MTCAQGLLRLLWGGPEVGVLRDCMQAYLQPASVKVSHYCRLISVFENVEFKLIVICNLYSIFSCISILKS